jgi:hypothetical protein
MRLLANLLVGGLLAAAGAAWADMPDPELPRADPECIRLNTPGPILAAMAAAGLDNAAARKVAVDNADALHRTAIVCHVVESAEGARRVGEVEEAIAIETFEKQNLVEHFGVNPADLEAAWRKIATASRLSYWKLMQGQGADVLTADAKSDFRAFAAGVGIKGTEAAQALALYAMARSYLEALAAS